MKIIDYSNQIQKEAILNECKGNIFEFLVAQGLSAKSKMEDQFLLKLPLEFKQKLSSYEELIREHSPELLIQLPKLAKNTVHEIWIQLRLECLNIFDWKVIGKMVATNDNQFWNETDIVGIYKDSLGIDQHISLSIKLSKDHSFTNTKSAGVKSFILKYFSSFEQVASAFQLELNNEVDESFLVMGHKLYSMIDSSFKGSFDSSWSLHYPELPGELPDDMKHIVHENYQRVASKLTQILIELKKNNSDLFFQSLSALCGFGHPEIIQISCFHNDYDLKEVTIKKFDDFFQIKNNECEILQPKKNASSVEIKLGKLLLQVRIKPMNKFTTAAYKINCSIKVLT